MRSAFLSVFYLSIAEWLTKSLPVCACNIFRVTERSRQYDETLSTRYSLRLYRIVFFNDDLLAVFRSWSVTGWIFIGAIHVSRRSCRENWNIFMFDFVRFSTELKVALRVCVLMYVAGAVVYQSSRFTHLLSWNTKC